MRTSFRFPFALDVSSVIFPDDMVKQMYLKYVDSTRTEGYVVNALYDEYSHSKNVESFVLMLRQLADEIERNAPKEEDA